MNYIISIKQSSVKLSWKMYMNVMIVCLKLHWLDDDDDDEKTFIMLQKRYIFKSSLNFLLITKSWKKCILTY